MLDGIRSHRGIKMKKGIWTIVFLSQVLGINLAHAQTHHHRHKLHVSTAANSLNPHVQSNIALIVDEQTQQVIYDKHAELVAPIASITKLMTAMVILDAKLPMDEVVSVATDDQDRLKGTHSRLRIGMTFTRSEMLQMALMASENRAASALARSYPGGMVAAVAAMNVKAKQLGMTSTKFFDPTGLNSDNVSTAHDLVKMVAAARTYPLIHQYTTTASTSIEGWRGRELRFHNTNPLVRNASWDIGVSKTGFINEAGRCLVMQATIKQRPVIIVLLDSWGKRTRVGDANRIKKWMESSNAVGRVPRPS
ncbi:MAG: D-alanyl-D-alanine endopeptidase [Gallionella sp.]|jgi:D-alanyl-D-alanine endopeptidase (penicillin-binding protein 7)|nr:D-alanyl-D-alanine endopeptidase [Gallionella sp.]